mgnify:CR=1 FL=1
MGWGSGVVVGEMTSSVVRGCGERQDDLGSSMAGASLRAKENAVHPGSRRGEVRLETGAQAGPQGSPPPTANPARWGLAHLTAEKTILPQPPASTSSSTDGEIFIVLSDFPESITCCWSSTIPDFAPLRASSWRTSKFHTVRSESRGAGLPLGTAEDDFLPAGQERQGHAADAGLLGQHVQQDGHRQRAAEAVHDPRGVLRLLGARLPPPPAPASASATFSASGLSPSLRPSLCPHLASPRLARSSTPVTQPTSSRSSRRPDPNPSPSLHPNNTNTNTNTNTDANTNPTSSRSSRRSASTLTSLYTY